ncbi:MAG: cytochrome C oxidase subunit IV family protein [Planctomycetota bacterium]|nr:cytochrome C oxidase subunit IV family protein [Planctomycetota bacterium]
MSQANDHHDEPHLIPYKTYILVWLGLCSLTLLTVAVSYANMRHMTIPVALMVASLKCTIVVLWFMHIKFENRVLWWFLIAAVGTYVIFVILTFADYSYR